MARTHRAPSLAQIFRGNASRAGKPIWNGRIESGRKLGAVDAALGGRHRARGRRSRFQVRRHDGPGLAAGLDVPLGCQQGISGFDGASCQTQFLGQRAGRGNAVTRLQQTARNGAAKPIVDLAIERVRPPSDPTARSCWVLRRSWTSPICGLAPRHYAITRSPSPPEGGEGNRGCKRQESWTSRNFHSWTLGAGHAVRK